jgi:flagellar protein FliO/FliZ
MTQGWLSIALLVVLLAMLPIGLKWLQRRVAGNSGSLSATTKVVSAIAVGPHQRVVTVETGPQEARVWLTLGVTNQHISCLHTTAAPGRFAVDKAPEAGQSLVITP